MQILTIEGTVTYVMSKAGKPLKGMDADPICGSSHKDGKALTESFITDENNNLKIVLVWMEGVLVT